MEAQDGMANGERGERRRARAGRRGVSCVRGSLRGDSRELRRVGAIEALDHDRDLAVEACDVRARRRQGEPARDAEAEVLVDHVPRVVGERRLQDVGGRHRAGGNAPATVAVQQWPCTRCTHMHVLVHSHA